MPATTTMNAKSIDLDLSPDPDFEQRTVGNFAAVTTELLRAWSPAWRWTMLLAAERMVIEFE